MPLAVLVVQLEVQIWLLHALHVPKIDLVQVRPRQADGPLLRDQGEFRRKVLLVDVHRGVDGSHDPGFEAENGGDAVIHLEPAQRAALPLVRLDLAEEVMDHVDIMAGLRIQDPAVEFGRSVPVDLEILVVAIPQDVADELMDFPEPAAVDQALHKGNQRIVAVLVDGQQPLAGLFHAPIDLMGFAQRQRQRFFADDLGGIRQFRHVGDVAGMQPRRRQHADDVRAADLPVIRQEGHAQPFGRLLRLRLDLVADQDDFEARVGGDGFDVALHDAPATHQCNFLHVSLLCRGAAFISGPISRPPRWHPVRFRTGTGAWAG